MACIRLFPATLSGDEPEHLIGMICVRLQSTFEVCQLYLEDIDV
jgi:hypothetical protein